MGSINPLLNQEYRNVKKQKYLNMKLFKMEVREKKIVGLKNIWKNYTENLPSIKIFINL